jgi:tripartite-type tricarboxylate transporter receptor subunit TctC
MPLGGSRRQIRFARDRFSPVSGWFVFIWLLLACAPLRAQGTVESFYKGRTITITIGFPPAGSYDLYARLVAAHMGKYIAGHPNFIVQNRSSGGIAALRAFYENAPKDGATIGIFPETVAIVQLTHPDLGAWKVQELSYIGSLANVNAVFLLRKGAPAQTIDALKKIPVNVGCNSQLGVSYINPEIMKKLAGFAFHIICGYPGTNSLPVAIARGEIDMVSGAWTAWKGRSEVSDGTLWPVIQSGLKRHKDLANVPLMQELVSAPQDKMVIEFMSAGSAIGRALIVPGGVPSERVSALRDAFDQMTKDPAFLKMAEDIGAEIDPTSGEATQAISNAILATPPAVVQRAIEASK